MAYVDMGKSQSEAKKDSDTMQYIEMTCLKRDVKTEAVNQGYVEMAGVTGYQDATKMDTIDVGHVEMIGISHEKREQKILDSESAGKLKEKNIMIGGIYFPKSIIIDHENFSMDAMLGEGQFGAVFMGNLDIGAAR